MTSFIFILTKNLSFLEFQCIFKELKSKMDQKNFSDQKCFIELFKTRHIFIGINSLFKYFKSSSPKFLTKLSNEKLKEESINKF